MGVHCPEPHHRQPLLSPIVISVPVLAPMARKIPEANNIFRKQAYAEDCIRILFPFADSSEKCSSDQF